MLSSAMLQEDPTTKPPYVRPTAGARGMTGLHYAAYSNDVDGVRAQLAAGIPVDVRSDNGWTPLHWSIDMSQAWGEPELVVSLLLKNGASVNAVYSTGFSTLMMACGRNNLNILKQLLAAGADVHMRTQRSTPLHEAAGCNFHESIYPLLMAGADPLLKDDRGRTAEQAALKNGFDEFVAVLQAFRSSK